MLKTGLTLSFLILCFVSKANNAFETKLNFNLSQRIFEKTSLTSFSLARSARGDDTTYIHIPKRGELLSALLPGAGQVYNELGYRKVASKKHRAWWKIPLIYGGLGAFGYYFYHNNQFANLTRQEILKRRELEIPDGGYYDQRFANYFAETDLINGFDLNENTTFIGYDKYANRRDIFAFAFVAFWGLNVVESFVDGHFVTFDVSEDLSLSWSPTLLSYQTPGINLRLNFN